MPINDGDAIAGLTYGVKSHRHNEPVQDGRERVKRTAFILAAATTLALAAPSLAQTPAQDVTAVMQGELEAQVLEGCNTELSQYCAEVTPGDGRLLACLYAYGDKLSGQCEYALYEAAARLERAISTVTYVASECRSELETHCAGVEMGEGRIAQCLNDHASELSPGCDRALTDVGIK
jgi:Cysteine rich repeat